MFLGNGWLDLIKRNFLFLIGFILSYSFLIFVYFNQPERKTTISDVKPIQLDPDIEKTLVTHIGNYPIKQIICFIGGDRENIYKQILGYHITSDGMVEIFLKDNTMQSFAASSCKFSYEAEISKK